MAQNNLQKEKQTLYIGRQGENEVLTIEFDMSDFSSEFGTGTAVLVHRRATDQRPYIVETTMSNNILTWVVTDVDTHIDGTGTCEIRWVVGEKVKKSAIFYTSITAALMDLDAEEPGTIVYMTNTNSLDERYMAIDNPNVVRTDMSTWSIDTDGEYTNATLYRSTDNSAHEIKVAGTKYVNTAVATVAARQTTIETLSSLNVGGSTDSDLLPDTDYFGMSLDGSAGYKYRLVIDNVETYDGNFSATFNLIQGSSVSYSAEITGDTDVIATGNFDSIEVTPHVDIITITWHIEETSPLVIAVQKLLGGDE